MKVAIVTDTHFGARSDSKVFADYFYKFWNDTFFPYLKEHNIDTIVHCGDLMDRRKYINFDTLARMRREFIQPMIERDITMHTIVGNHDTYFKNTVEVNSVEQLFDVDGHSPIIAYSKPQNLTFPDGTNVDIIPWINDSTEDIVSEFIKKSTTSICFGHFDLTGFEMMKGVKSQYHSRDKSFLDKYSMAFSGHFHCKSDDGHIYYLGAPYEMTWADWNDDRGFHIFDTETHEMERIVNPHIMHEKIYYDDSDLDVDADIRQTHDVEKYRDKLVKLIVAKKSKWANFESLVDNLEQVVLELQIVEDFSLASDDDETLDAEDTITVLNNYVDGMDLDEDKEPVRRLIQELYVEAINI